MLITCLYSKARMPAPRTPLSHSNGVRILHPPRPPTMLRRDITVEYDNNGGPPLLCPAVLPRSRRRRFWVLATEHVDRRSDGVGNAKRQPARAHIRYVGAHCNGMPHTLTTCLHRSISPSDACARRIATRSLSIPPSIHDRLHPLSRLSGHCRRAARRRWANRCCCPCWPQQQWVQVIACIY
jgi:hypothetical protein